MVSNLTQPPGTLDYLAGMVPPEQVLLERNERFVFPVIGSEPLEGGQFDEECFLVAY